MRSWIGKGYLSSPDVVARDLMGLMRYSGHLASPFTFRPIGLGRTITRTLKGYRD